MTRPRLRITSNRGSSSGDYASKAQSKLISQGYHVNYLTTAARPNWITPSGMALKPPEVECTLRLPYPFDLDRQSQEIADWVVYEIRTLIAGVNALLPGLTKHMVTFRPVSVSYSPSDVGLMTKVSCCAY